MNKKRKRVLILLLIIIVIELIAGFSLRNKRILKIKLYNEKNKQEEILSHYNKFVTTNDEADIYIKNNTEYKKIGMINKDEILELKEQNITYQDIYFIIENLDQEYYIKYDDVDIVENKIEYEERYKKYIPFNKNIVTKETTNLYDENDKLVYRINKSFDLPIIIKEEEKYGIELNNRLLYIKNSDVDNIKDNINTNDKNTNGIAVLNYHFFYDASTLEDTNKCNQIICLSTQKLKEELDYIIENNIFTPNMKELEMYIDEKINLPKSVVLTIDDGWRADIGSNIIAEYKLNGTVFLMSKDYDKNAYKNEYIEVHSHGHDLHKPGVCPKGQGGGIQCLNKSILLDDLKKSRQALDNTTVFCYPFYEYNNYSIEVLKEAGFTMAFGGPNEGGHKKVSPKIDKFRLPRYIIYTNTTLEEIKSYIN